MSDPEGDGLTAHVEAFAGKLDSLVTACLPNAPGVVVTQFGSRYGIKPDGQTEKKGGIPLCVSGDPLAELRFDYFCRWDTAEEFLAVDRSKVWVVAAVDSTPLFRYEYLYEADWVPHSHIQVHGQRGALSHLLSRAGHDKPHDMAALHLPTGGARFRPNLEDVIQFLISDCGFDSLPGWKESVDRERAEWREIQTRAVVRSMPDVAASQLESLGYRVQPPEGGHPRRNERVMYAW